MQTHDLLGVGLQIVLRLPGLLVMLVGVVVALATMRRDRRRAGLATAGFAALLLGAVISLAAAMMPWLAANSGMSWDTVSTVFTVSSLVNLLLGLAGWACVIVALLIRPRADTPPVTPPPVGGFTPNATPGGL